MDGSFKALKQSDVFLTSYISRKQWSFVGEELAENGVILHTYNTEYGDPFFPIPLPEDYRYEEKLRYIQANLDYFKGSMTGSLDEGYVGEFAGSFTGSLDLILQSTINLQGGRKLPRSLGILSIPRKLVGENIEEGSIELSYNAGKVDWKIVDREGLLLSKDRHIVVGNIIYNRGILLLDEDMLIHLPGRVEGFDSLSWRSKKTVYTLNINCKVEDKENNCTYNPTVTGNVQELMGTSEFTPYVTSVGLYNRVGELMAVAKLGKPVRKVDNIDTTFKISLDIS